MRYGVFMPTDQLEWHKLKTRAQALISYNVSIFRFACQAYPMFFNLCQTQKYGLIEPYFLFTETNFSG